jgi:hypothetical protein
MMNESSYHGGQDKEKGLFIMKFLSFFFTALISTEVYSQQAFSLPSSWRDEAPQSCEYFISLQGPENKWATISRLNILTGETTKNYYLPKDLPAAGIAAKEGKLYMARASGAYVVFLGALNPGTVYEVNRALVNQLSSLGPLQVSDSGHFRESGGEFVASSLIDYKRPIISTINGLNILSTPSPFPYQNTGTGFLDFAEQFDGYWSATYGLWDLPGPGTSLVRYDTIFSSPVVLKHYPDLQFTGLAAMDNQFIAVTESGELYAINPLSGQENFLRMVQFPEPQYSTGTRALDLTTSCKIFEQPKACEFFVAEKGTSNSSVSRYNPYTGELIKRYTLPKINGQKVIPNGLGADEFGRLVISYPFNSAGGPYDTLLRPDGVALMRSFLALNTQSSINRPSDGGHFHEGRLYASGGYNYAGSSQLIQSDFVNGKIHNTPAPAQIDDDGWGLSDLVVRAEQNGENKIYGWWLTNENGAVLYRYDMNLTNPQVVAYFPGMETYTPEQRVTGLANRPDGQIWAVTATGNLKIINPENGVMENSGINLQNLNGEVLDLAATYCENSIEAQSPSFNSLSIKIDLKNISKPSKNLPKEASKRK